MHSVGCGTVLEVVLRWKTWLITELWWVVVAFSVLFVEFYLNINNIRWHVVAQWLRHCATNQKVVGLIPDGVTGIFH
jgi:hypothetical protein